MSKVLSDKRLFIIDIDEVLCSHDVALPGAHEAIDALRRAGKEIRFLTNDAWSSRDSRAKELHEQGIRISPHEIYTSSFLTASYIRSLGSPPTLLLSGGEGVKEFAGIPLREDSVEVVVVGDLFDSYSRTALERAYSAVINGARLIAMQNDQYWMDGDTPRINIGFWVAGLEYCTGTRAKVIGKPAIESYHFVLQDVGVSPAEALMISDSLDSDLVGAKKAGLFTIHIQRSLPMILNTEALPADLTIESLSEVVQFS